MSFKNLLGKTVAAAAAAVLSVGVLVAPAQAVPGPLTTVDGLLGSSAPSTTDTPGGKQLVTFGDSFTANGGMPGQRSTPAELSKLMLNCRTDPQNWAKIAGQELGLTVGDWSCNGQTSPTLALAIEGAIQYGDLGPNTKEVVLMYGGLDPLYWVNTVEQAAPGGDFGIYDAQMKLFTDRIRSAAPNARITMTSYLEMISANEVCLANMPVQASVKLPLGMADQTQSLMRDSLRSVAHNTGSNWIDVYEESRGHGNCNPDPAQRWFVALIKPLENAPAMMFGHPTDAGHIGVGHIIANNLRNA